MLEDPMMMMLLSVGVIALLIAFLVKSKQSAKAGGGKKGKKGKARAKSSKKNNAVDAEAVTEKAATPEEDETWNEWEHSAVSANVVDDTKVSVQDVDVLTEFNVYKQFGYYDKAAESLSAYLDKTQRKDPQLANELIGLWLQAKNVDAVAEAINQQSALLRNS